MKRNRKLNNALSLCDSEVKKEVVLSIYDIATNPFVIYQNDFVSRETLLRKIERSGTFSEAEISSAIFALLQEGVISEKKSWMSRERSYSVTRSAVLGEMR